MEKEMDTPKSIARIDTIQIIKILLKAKKRILKFIIISVILGLLVAIFSPTEYTSSSIFTTVSSGKSVGKGLSGIVAALGVNVNDSEESVIFPVQYPLIFESTPFKKDILKTLISVEDQDSLVTLSYYLSDLKKTSLLTVVKKYTIGLPGVILRSFKKEKKAPILNDRDSAFHYLNEKEIRQLDYIYSNLVLNRNDEEGYVEILGTMPEAKSSAQLVNKVQNLLQKFIIDFNIKKAEQDLLFIESRFKNAEDVYFAKRSALAEFRDKNLNLTRNLAQTRIEQLQTEYNLSFQLYSQLSGELENAKLKVARDTPIFTVLKPITIPIEASSPRRFVIMFGSFIVGLFLGILVTLFKHFYPHFKKNLSGN